METSKDEFGFWGAAKPTEAAAAADSNSLPMLHHPIRIVCFFTVWALGLHLLHLAGLLPSTWPLALFVFVCSQLMVWRTPGYYRMYNDQGALVVGGMVAMDVIGHWLPLLLVQPSASVSGVALFIAAGLAYLATFGPRFIDALYSDPASFFRNGPMPVQPWWR